MQVLLHQIVPRCADMISHPTATFRTCTRFRQHSICRSGGRGTRDVPGSSRNRPGGDGMA